MISFFYNMTSLFSQWITSSINNALTACYITFWVRTSNVMTTHDKNAFFIETLSILKAIKSFLIGNMINRILHEWSFHTKFIKLAKGSVDKFPIK